MRAKASHNIQKQQFAIQKFLLTRIQHFQQMTPSLKMSTLTQAVHRKAQVYYGHVPAVSHVFFFFVLFFVLFFSLENNKLICLGRGKVDCVIPSPLLHEKENAPLFCKLPNNEMRGPLVVTVVLMTSFLSSCSNLFFPSFFLATPARERSFAHADWQTCTHTHAGAKWGNANRIACK